MKNLSLSEIRQNAQSFSIRWKDEKSERSESQTFWNEFFEIFGIYRRSKVLFDNPIKKLGSNASNFIDAFWPGLLLIEHKSYGKSLDKAFEQGADYTNNLKENEFPQYIITCDFNKIRIYDLDSNKNYDEFNLNELSKKIYLFHFLTGFKQTETIDEVPVNQIASEKIQSLYNFLIKNNYNQNDCEIFLKKLIYCFFADDSGIFLKNIFYEYIINTNENGSNLGNDLIYLFEILDTPISERASNLEENLSQFPYINGGIFFDKCKTPQLNRKSREIILECSKFDWSTISPAIFGGLFQIILQPKKRNELGAFFTSVKNIKKLIENLFINELKNELKKISEIKNESKYDQLKKFYEKISNLKFLDPACGSGNFLIVAYTEIRKLELEILKLTKDNFNISYSKIRIENFVGFEIDQLAVNIAKLSIWISEHISDKLLSIHLEKQIFNIPISDKPNILCLNALSKNGSVINWFDEITFDYIFGNPPFIGKQNRNIEQKKDMEVVFSKVKKTKFKELDYVACWFYICAKIIHENPNTKAAFVTTDSVIQGEQSSILWYLILNQFNIDFNFALTSFKWSAEISNTSNVSVAIIGLKNSNKKEKKYILEHVNKNELIKKEVKNINNYLLNTDNTFVFSIKNHINSNIKAIFGSMPNDGGSLIFDDEDISKIFKEKPEIKKFFRKFISADDYLQNNQRWCLWLKDHNPTEYMSFKYIKDAIYKCKSHRLASKRPATNKLSNFPHLFGEDRQPDNDYILIPRVTSERRLYIPIDFVTTDYVASDASIIIPTNDKFLFGILTSRLHSTWMRIVSGRLEGRYRYSIEITYNNFPIIKNNKILQNEIIDCVDTILKFRKKTQMNLYNLYHPDGMSRDLIKLHNILDEKVEKLYFNKKLSDDTERIINILKYFREFNSEFSNFI